MFPSCCLVSVDGVNECISNDVQNSGKMNTFLGIFAGVNECNFCAKFVSFAVGFHDSLAQGSKELWRCQNSCLSGSVFWHFLWPQVAKKHGVPKIRVFLGRIFGISLASGSKETWHSRNSCLSACSNFVL